MLGYDFLKEYCKKNKIELADDYPEDKLISSMTIKNLKIFNENGVEIKGMGNQISILNDEEFEISIIGIISEFYKIEFPHHHEKYYD